MTTSLSLDSSLEVDSSTDDGVITKEWGFPD